MPNNIIIYKRICQLKDYLEVTEFDEYTRKQIEAVNEHITEIFKLLDRRAGK
jgi:hypothetical protein